MHNDITQELEVPEEVAGTGARRSRPRLRRSDLTGALAVVGIAGFLLWIGLTGPGEDAAETAPRLEIASARPAPAPLAIETPPVSVDRVPAPVAEPALPAPREARIQLLSGPSKDGAERARRRLARAHRDLLASLPLTIEPADLGARGITYRVRTGPFPSEEEAASVCAALAARGQACVFVD